MENNFNPINDFKLPSWWKETTEGKEVMREIARLKSCIKDAHEIISGRLSLDGAVWMREYLDLLY